MSEPKPMDPAKRRREGILILALTPLVGSLVAVLASVAAVVSQAEWMFVVSAYLANGIGWLAVAAGALGALRLPLHGHARFFTVAGAVLLTPYVLLVLVQLGSGAFARWLERLIEGVIGRS